MRLEDWQARGQAWLDRARLKSLDWKDHHCAFMAADACEAMTGEDPAAAWRKKSPAAMKAQSAKGVFALVPYEEIPVAKARRFDLLGFEGEHGETLAVCLGREALAFIDDGRPPGFVPSAAAARAWRVE